MLSDSFKLLKDELFDTLETGLRNSWTASWMEFTHIEWDVSMSSIHEANREASITCHRSMNGTLRQEGAVDVVGCVAWHSTDHICRICQFKRLLSFDSSVWMVASEEVKQSDFKSQTYVLEVDGHLIFSGKMILQKQIPNKKNMSYAGPVPERNACVYMIS